MIDDILLKANQFREEVVEVCSELVKCRSDHPEGRTDTCIDYIQNYFNKIGIDTQVYEKEEGKPNIVAHLEGTSDRGIIWLGHLDVVPVGDLENWIYPPFSGEINDGRVWGRGASDMKGSNASAMVSAKLLKEFETPYNIDYWFTADEEIGGRAGARWLAETNKFKGNVAIVGDSSGCSPSLVNIALGNKGGMGCRLSAKGKTAHGSTPYLGENAIDKLLNAIPYVKKLAEYKLELPEEINPIIESTIEFMLKDDSLNELQRESVRRLFYYPSGPSLNLINGGVKVNVVPDSAEAVFDIRLTPGTDAELVKKALDDYIAESGINDITIEARVSPKVGYYEKIDEPAVKAMVSAVEKVTNESPYYTLAPWGTDAVHIKRNTISETYPEGIPCILYGPMHRDQLHQPNEYVSIDNLVTALKVYSIFPFFFN
jgi:succinyl-diaminopimelate desuccinylase